MNTKTICPKTLATALESLWINGNLHAGRAQCK